MAYLMDLITYALWKLYRASKRDEWLDYGQPLPDESYGHDL